LTLLEFIIRIRLVAGRSAADLRKITLEANKTKTALNAAGEAATNYNRRLAGLGKSATKSKAAIQQLGRAMRTATDREILDRRRIRREDRADRGSPGREDRADRGRPGRPRPRRGLASRIGRSLRVGGGISLGSAGGVGLSVNPAVLIGSLSGLGTAGAVAAGAIGALTGAAIVAAKALNAFEKIDAARAKIAIGLDATKIGPDGKTTAKSIAELTDELGDLAELAKKPVEKIVKNAKGDSVNVFQASGELDRLEAIDALAKNNFKKSEINSGTIGAYLASSLLGEGASAQDKARAIEVATAAIKARGGDISAELMGETARVLMIASTTSMDPKEAIRMIPKASMQARIANWQSAETAAFASFMKQNGAAGATGKQTGAWIDIALRSSSAPSKKAAEFMAKEGLKLTDDRGMVLAPELWLKALRDWEAANPLKAAEGFKTMFGQAANMVRLAVTSTDDFKKTLNQFDAGADRTLEFALLTQAETLAASRQRLDNAVNDIMASVADGALGQSYVKLLDFLSQSLEDDRQKADQVVAYEKRRRAEGTPDQVSWAEVFGFGDKKPDPNRPMPRKSAIKPDMTTDAKVIS
jgi:hypothetical protein